MFGFECGGDSLVVFGDVELTAREEPLEERMAAFTFTTIASNQDFLTGQQVEQFTVTE